MAGPIFCFFAFPTESKSVPDIGIRVYYADNIVGQAEHHGIAIGGPSISQGMIVQLITLQWTNSLPSVFDNLHKSWLLHLINLLACLIAWLESGNGGHLRFAVHRRNDDKVADQDAI